MHRSGLGLTHFPSKHDGHELVPKADPQNTLLPVIGVLQQRAQLHVPRVRGKRVPPAARYYDALHL